MVIAFIVGAATLGFGILLGASITKSAYENSSIINNFNNQKDI